MIDLAAAQAWIDRSFAPIGRETVPLAAASGRVLAEARAALAAGPMRAAIDGFAVAAAMTEGASDYAPLPLPAYPIVAGGVLPSGTDAVLPAHLVEAGAALAAAAPGEGALPPDALAVPEGAVLNPALLAALALRGDAAIAVIRRPVVRLGVAGPKAGADALTPMLHALIEALGGVVGEAAPDLVLHAGRSGPGPDDDGVRRLDTVFAHGVRIRPGETAALGTLGGCPALLLPGDPLACFVAFVLLAGPALRRAGVRPDPEPVRATLGRKVVSGLGLADAVRVRVRDGIAIPAGPSLAEMADGLLLVPEGSEGYPAGAAVAISPLP